MSRRSALEGRDLALLAELDRLSPRPPTDDAAARELAAWFRRAVDGASAVVIIESAGGTARARDPDTGAPGGRGERSRLWRAGDVHASVSVTPRRRWRPRDDLLLDAAADRLGLLWRAAAAESAVAGSERRLADVIGSASDVTVVVGPDGRVEAWNPAAETVLGVTAAEAVGRPAAEVLRLACADGRAFPDRQVLRRRRPVGSVEVRAGGDGDRWLDCSWSPLPDGGWVLVGRDVTERRRLASLREDFLATVSHELRTPITPVLGFLRTLERAGDRLDAERRAAIIAQMTANVRRLQRLVADLLDATAPEVARLRPEVVDPGRVVREAVDELTAGSGGAAGGTGPVEVVVEGRPPEVVADPEAVTRILGHLLDNAWKFGGPDQPVTVRIVPDGPEVRIEVSDAGPGVPPEERSRIFEPFVRVEGHLVARTQGAGLGLHIARRLVEASGGEIGVTDSPAGGATFWFTLPAADEYR